MIFTPLQHGFHNYEALMNVKLSSIMLAPLFLVSGCLMLTSQSQGIDMHILQNLLDGKFTTLREATNVFPLSVADIDARVCYGIERYRAAINRIIALPARDRNLHNTVLDYEKIESDVQSIASTLQIISFVSPDDKLRNHANKVTTQFQNELIEICFRPELYAAFKSYEEGPYRGETLTDEEEYYFKETLKSFHRNGFDLPIEQFERLKELNKQMGELCITFRTNISEDNSTIAVTREALAGVDQAFIKQLAQDEKGLFVLHADYPTQEAVMLYCSDASTRLRYYELFNNRGYPKNKAVLTQLINLRDEYARLLGYKSYAQYDIDATMARTSDAVKTFIQAIAPKSMKRAREELMVIEAERPADVKLSPAGKLYPQDRGYLTALYKKHHYDLDNRVIAQYFPMEKTIQGLFTIYQTILGLSFKEMKPDNVWHPDVRAIEVTDTATGQLRGFVYLDMHPRPNKYSHACEAGALMAVKTNAADGSEMILPTVCVIICNFKKPTAETPSLLTHREVTTFFHEFGHAMHQVLGATELRSFSGTSTKIDFVEMPSQMFEEWMWDKAMLQKVSAHYQTGEPLPDELIDNMIAARKLNAALNAQSQLWLASLALELHEAGVDKDIDVIIKRLSNKYFPYLDCSRDDHLYANFDHLAGYNAKYYGYMWSNVFALDMFERFKKEGLLNPSVGHDLVTKVLGRGGSVDPNILLHDFLGREPNQDAFLRNLGVEV